MKDLEQLKDELRWCIDHVSGPRTESTLRWALEIVEAMEQTTEEQR